MIHMYKVTSMYVSHVFINSKIYNENENNKKVNSWHDDLYYFRFKSFIWVILQSYKGQKFVLFNFTQLRKPKYGT